MHKKITYIIYQVLMALLAIASIVMLIAYYANEINICLLYTSDAADD